MAEMGPHEAPNTEVPNTDGKVLVRDRGGQVGGNGGGAQGDTGSQSTRGPGGQSPLSRTLRSHGGMRAMLPLMDRGMAGIHQGEVADQTPPRTGEDESSKWPGT